MEKLIRARGVGDFFRVNPLEAYRYRKATEKLIEALTRYETSIERTGEEFEIIKEREKKLPDGYTYSIKLSAQRSASGFVVRVDHEKVRPLEDKRELQLLRTEIDIDNGSITAVRFGELNEDDLSLDSSIAIWSKSKGIDGMGAQANMLDRLAESIYGLKEDRDEILTGPFKK